MSVWYVQILDIALGDSWHAFSRQTSSLGFFAQFWYASSFHCFDNVGYVPETNMRIPIFKIIFLFNNFMILTLEYSSGVSYSSRNKFMIGIFKITIKS